jgi:hypothetical protein
MRFTSLSCFWNSSSHVFRMMASMSNRPRGAGAAIASRRRSRPPGRFARRSTCPACACRTSTVLDPPTPPATRRGQVGSGNPWQAPPALILPSRCLAYWAGGDFVGTAGNARSAVPMEVTCGRGFLGFPRARLEYPSHAPDGALPHGCAGRTMKNPRSKETPTNRSYPVSPGGERSVVKRGLANSCGGTRHVALSPD